MSATAIPRVGTIMLQPTGSNCVLPVEDRDARKLIAEQYGECHEFVEAFPGRDRATLSTKGGILTYFELKSDARCSGAAKDDMVYRIRELELCLHGLVGLGRKDTSNPKYDGYYEHANNLLKGLK